MARPFLKWAGGKGQLIPELMARMPPELGSGKITRYVEPMVGGGALFFHLASQNLVREYYISDINKELILAYKVIKRDVQSLIDALGELEREYLSREPEARKRRYYEIRESFNLARDSVDYKTISKGAVERVAQTIFLNRTCYNGLFRVNAKGGFNVPFGDYPNPRICDAENLQDVARVLSRTKVKAGTFRAWTRVIKKHTLVYFDPPYRPLSVTASFTSYSKYNFNDHDQEDLASYYKELAGRRAYVMLSNSDPTNANPKDRFFDDLYAPPLRIFRVPAVRLINSNAARRGPVRELIVTSYEPSPSAAMTLFELHPNGGGAATVGNSDGGSAGPGSQRKKEASIR